MKRVVVTGMAGFSPIGMDWPTIANNLRTMQTGIRHMPEWDIYSIIPCRYYKINRLAPSIRYVLGI